MKMKINPETDFYEADFVVAIRFEQPPETIARLAEKIATDLRHIPSYWTMDDSMRRTVDMLFRNPKVIGNSISFDLPLADKTKEGLLAAMKQLTEIAKIKLGGCVEKMIVGKEKLQIQVVLFGERSSARKRLKELGLLSITPKRPRAPAAP